MTTPEKQLKAVNYVAEMLAEINRIQALWFQQMNATPEGRAILNRNTAIDEMASLAAAWEGQD